MEENDYETRFIREEIGRCEDLDELKARIFPLLQSQHELWMQKMQEILAESGLTKSAFAKRCRVSRVSVDKWCKGAIPKNRETFLRIGMAAEYDLEKMNQLLRRYGQYPELYSKSLEDCVCIYVLNHRFDMDCVDNRESEKGEEAYGLTAYDYILSQIKENMAADADMEIPDINTAQFAERLSQVEDADALTQFIYDNIMYAELNTKSDYCQCCGYDGEIKIVEDDGKLVWECPNCGNRDQEKMNVARRTCGYIGTQFWNQGRTEEIRDRVLHL